MARYEEKGTGYVQDFSCEDCEGGGHLEESTAVVFQDSVSHRLGNLYFVRWAIFGLWLILTMVMGVAIIRQVLDDNGNCSKEALYYEISALILIVSIGMMILMHEQRVMNQGGRLVPTGKNPPQEQHQMVDNSSVHSKAAVPDGSIETNTLPPTPPPPLTRKLSSYNVENGDDLSTTTIHRNNTSTAVAEYFPSTTIMFADIVGFTAWSSIRDPYQVFTLLETIYDAFDSIAESKSVFKVETIGDCWVGATGIPKPQDDHAVIMATFSRRCLDKVLSLLGVLEETLGPGTSELGMRFGLHSGPIIGGILRGSKCRFQLFGDTMNVASRIESTSVKNKIHLSEQTADLLIAAGKGAWVEHREGKILAKGKGELQTFWLTTNGPKNLSHEVKLALPAISKFLKKAKIEPAFCEQKSAGDGKGRTQRLVEYNVKVMDRLLKRLVATRGDDGHSLPNMEELIASYSPQGIVEEAKREIPFALGWKFHKHPKGIDLVPAVTSQLHELISKVAGSYLDLPFHCFEHASHTILSVTKLLASLEATQRTFESVDDQSFETCVDRKVCEMLTHPMVQFALVFAAMVHDMGYEVPNFQLVKERSEIAKTYKNRSCAEQNSIHSAWTLLMEPAFKDLRGCLFGSQDELRLFRSLLVKSVMATDIWDKEQVSSRERQWNQVIFGLGEGFDGHMSVEQLTTQKAGVVVEYLIQVSDVSHTTQHLNIFTKWNKLLFKEMFLGYKAGRASNNPADNWYEGELKFFDGHVIPLVNRLCECQVFRASAEICLTNAINNRRKWEQRGNSAVQEYLEVYETKSAVASVISQRGRLVPSMVALIERNEGSSSSWSQRGR